MTGNPSAVAVLITSTDLFVGKTFVASGLARALRDRGYSVGVMKPIELGWSTETDGQWPLDAERLREAAGSDDPIEDVVPYIFEEMVAPQVAADRLIDLGVAPGSIQLTLERNMQCATGRCGHCQLGPALLCRDGPVMTYPEIADALRVRER